MRWILLARVICLRPHPPPCTRHIRSIICSRIRLLCGRRSPERLGKSLCSIGISRMMRRPRSLRRLLRCGFRLRSAVVRAAGGGRGVCRRSLGRSLTAASRGGGICIIRVRNVDTAIFPSVCIVFCSLIGVAQYLVSCLNLLKSFDKLSLASWVSVGMAFQGELSKCFSNFPFVCVRRDAQVCVIVVLGVVVCHNRGSSAAWSGRYGSESKAAARWSLISKISRQKRIQSCETYLH